MNERRWRLWDYCSPYCDMNATSGEQACETLCPGAFWDYDDFGVCMP